MSLAANRKLSEEGVLFRSHIDGSPHLLTPERAARLQLGDFGVDVAMVLDECTPYPATRDQAARSMDLTHRWARRGRDAFLGLKGDGLRGAQFGIVQGGMFPDLRRESAAAVAAMGFEGVGHPLDILHAVANGFDLFDCVLPTRAARHGLAYTSEGKVVIKHARYRTDPTPLDPACACPTCRTASRAYLRHLFNLGEATAATLLTVHNLTAILDLMRGIREALAARRFEAFAAEAVRRLDFGKDTR
jgi:queuine tRNA-ribosyltransferase